MTTILVTGFGPFPGAPFNPTGPLVKRLAHLRRPALTAMKIIPHVFPTSYAAVDRELPMLLTKYKPDGLLMFGLAPRARAVCIEMRARNTVSLRPGADGSALRGLVIAASRPAALAVPAPVRRLHAMARMAGVPVTLSRDAGRYLCNYLCWRAAEAVGENGGPRVAAFIHVPKVWCQPVPRARAKKTYLTIADLARAGGAILPWIAAAARR